MNSVNQQLSMSLLIGNIEVPEEKKMDTIQYMNAKNSELQMKNCFGACVSVGATNSCMWVAVSMYLEV